MCQERLAGRYELEVIDLYQQRNSPPPTTLSLYRRFSEATAASSDAHRRPLQRTTARHWFRSSALVFWSKWSVETVHKRGNRVSMASMSGPEETRERLLERIEQLTMRLEDAENTLQAIRQGEVDALVVSDPGGPQVYTLRSAGHPYRILVQEMQGGRPHTDTHRPHSVCESAFARMMRTSLEHLLGPRCSALWRHVTCPTSWPFRARGTEQQPGEVALQAADGTLVPAFLACNSFRSTTFRVCVWWSLISRSKKRQEEILVSEALARAILEQTAEALVVTDITGCIIRASQAAHQLAAAMFYCRIRCRVRATVAGTMLPAPSVADNDKAPVSILHAVLQGEVRQGLETTFVRPMATSSSYYSASAHC